MARILVVDDEMGIRELLSEILEDEGHDVVLAENARQAREQRQRARPDLVLLDIWMPDTDGITLLKEWAANGELSMPVVMMSGHGTLETAVEATRIGAQDFLEKPIALQKLLATVKKALRPRETKGPVIFSLASFGRSPIIVDLKKRLTPLGSSPAPLLLRGARGSLPEVYARYAQAPGTPWLQGAEVLTDAAKDVLSQTTSGLLFIEELAQLTQNQQRHLSFHLARGERGRVKIVSFTSVDPRVLEEERGFDPVLLARLSELSLVLPPLREFAEDIPEIAAQMLNQLVESQFCPLRRFSTSALNVLRQYHWPGNLESLRTAVRNLAVAAPEEEIGAPDAERVLREIQPEASSSGISLDQPLREAREAFERAYFEHHLMMENNNIARVAEKSGLERTHLYRKLKQIGLQTGRRDEGAPE
jgi:two-component system, NtrC family, nitrogen regulation response regulator NtrX